MSGNVITPAGPGTYTVYSVDVLGCGIGSFPASNPFSQFTG